MEQVVHIFRKDVRHLYPEILLVTVVAAFLAWRDPAWAEALVLLSSGFLIARVIHAEPIPGDRQFWITRPYRWRCLAAAKLLFIASFVNVPLFLAQLVIVVRDGFPLGATWPGLLWSQVLLVLCFSLPVAAIAAVTSGIVTFLFAMLVLLLVGSSVPQLILPAIALAPSLPQWPEPVQWIRNSAAVFLSTSILVTVFYLQYRTRHTWVSRCIALSSLAGAALLYLYSPSNLGLALEAGLSRTFPGSALGISANPMDVRLEPQKWTDRVLVRVPLTVTGIPDGNALKADAFTLSFVDPNGAVWKPQTPGSGVVQSSGRGVVNVRATAMMPASFRSQAQGRSLRLRGSFYFTLFGRTKTWKVPLRNTPVNVADGLQCYRGMFNQLYCRSIFRWPAREVFAKVFQTDLHSFNSVISYSPFPAVLDLNPVETHWADGGPESDTELTLVTRERVSTFRRDFEIPGVQLKGE